MLVKIDRIILESIKQYHISFHIDRYIMKLIIILKLLPVNK